MTAPRHLKEKHENMTADNVLATYYIDIKPRIILDDLAAFAEADIAEPETGDRVRILAVNGGSPLYVGTEGVLVRVLPGIGNNGEDIYEVDIFDGTPVFATAVEEVRVMQDDADVERDRATLAAARALIEDDLVIVDRDHDELRIERGSENDVVAYFVTGDVGTYVDTVEDLDTVIAYLTAIRTVKASEQ